MYAPALSTIGQLLYAQDQAFDFARIAADMEASLTRMRGGEIDIGWDCDEVISFNLPEARILLAWHEYGQHGESCLTVAVGPSEHWESDQTAPADTVILCSRLVERIRSNHIPNAILWSETAERVNSDTLETMTEKLPALPPYRSAVIRPFGRAAQGSREPMVGRAIGLQRRATVTAPALAETPDLALAANDLPDLPRAQDAALDRTRDALYAPVDERPSTQMRLAVHCLNATMILVWVPLGAAALTYSILKGEDMRLSSRLMVMTGMLLALAQSPLGHSVKAMASGMTF